MQLQIVVVATSTNRLFRIRSQWISVIMSMEIFQNVDEWLISTDVGSVLASCWKEAEPVPGSDDDGDTSYLTPACIADDFECYDVADYLNSPVQSKPPYSLFKQYLRVSYYWPSCAFLSITYLFPFVILNSGLTVVAS